jgi:hypothetical protein
MATSTDMGLHVQTAISGLIGTARLVDEALLGKRRHLNEQVAQHTGPFAVAMQRLGAIANGGEIQDLEAARKDLLFMFSLMHLQGGAFYDSMSEVLFAAHLRCADLITRAEAEALLGEHKIWLRLDAACGDLHLVVRSGEEKEWRGYDATYLGEPHECYEVRYAGYEVRAVRDKREKQAEAMKRWKADQQAAQAAS